MTLADSEIGLLPLLCGVFGYVPGNQAFHPFPFAPRPFPFGGPLDPQRVGDPLASFKLSGKSTREVVVVQGSPPVAVALDELNYRFVALVDQERLCSDSVTPQLIANFHYAFCFSNYDATLEY